MIFRQGSEWVVETGDVGAVWQSYIFH